VDAGARRDLVSGLQEGNCAMRAAKGREREARLELRLVHAGIAIERLVTLLADRMVEGEGDARDWKAVDETIDGLKRLTSFPYQPTLEELRMMLGGLADELEKSSYDDTTAEECAAIQRAMNKVKDACLILAAKT